jgi:oligo-1,6-glucosidase
MKRRWWKEGVVYQIYPRSFMDSNGDGVGDLRGICEKLDYLKSLGVDIVWLSPVFLSPNDDNGYDISDYRKIQPEFGTFSDWEQLLKGLHDRKMRLLMDLVANHTSDEHEWFVESRKSKDSPYRDYYIWRPPSESGEPNNWVSCFGGSAWQFDEVTGEYFLHLFSRKQPDLNWENPQVRQEIYDIMTFWLDHGVDGFRMDVINMISKVPGLPNAPALSPGRYQWGGQYFLHGPRLLEFLQEMKSKVLSHYDIFTVGEAPGVTTEHALDITQEEGGSLNMLFQFEHMDLDRPSDCGELGKWHVHPWELLGMKRVISRWQKDLDGKAWNSFYLSNHDQPRSVSRFGNDQEYRVESAKMLATFVHLLHGTPYVYQGEEIGMTNARFDSIEDYQDIETLNFYREWAIDRGADRQTILAAIQAKSRDNARTPIQWDASPQAGFTTGRPWLRVNSNYPQVNVQDALADPDSVFHYYRRLIELRRTYPIVVYGSYELLLESDTQNYAFLRRLESETWLVILNFSPAEAVFALPSHIRKTMQQLLISNYAVDEQEPIEVLTLRPYEARVYRVS